MGTFLSWGQGLWELGQTLEGEEKDQRDQGKGRGIRGTEEGRLRGLQNLLIPPGRPTCPWNGDPPHCLPASSQNPPTHLPPHREPQRVSIKSAPSFPSFSFPGDRSQGCRTWLRTELRKVQASGACAPAVTLLESFPEGSPGKCSLPFFKALGLQPLALPLPRACHSGIDDSSAPLPAASLSRVGWRVPLFWAMEQITWRLPETRIH